MNKPKLVAVSGGFDPLHVGHVRMIEAASKLGDELVVILNNDNWLIDKKGFTFMNQEERKEILSFLPFVSNVVISSHEIGDTDRSVAKELREIHPDIFANGGDRNKEDAQNPNSSLYKETQTCKELSIEMIFNVGHGGKVQSSSKLANTLRTQGITITRPWGSMVLYAHGENFWLKTITVTSGNRLSLQKHAKRGELWMCIKGDVYTVINGVEKTLKPFEVVQFEKETPHRLGSVNGGTIIEVGFGLCDEEDNLRLEDDYGRAS